MKPQTAQLRRKIPVTDDSYYLWLAAPGIARTARPGQFVQIRVGPGLDPFLRRPLSIAGVDGERLLVVFKIRGRGTALLARTNEGDDLDILGPLGAPIPVMENKRILLIGGGVGGGPLRFVAQTFTGKNKIFFILGARTEKELIFLDDIKKFSTGLEITTEDGSLGFKGRATDRLSPMLAAGEPDVIFACGPEGMLADVQRKLHVGLAVQKEVSGSPAVHKGAHGRTAYGFFEGRMGCGVGLCLGCALKKKTGGYLRVCTDGPVINLALVDLQ